MGAGIPSISTNKAVQAGGMPGPPFAPTSADNGLSVDGVSGKIVLGGAGSDLLDDRQITMHDNAIQLFDFGGTYNGFTELRGGGIGAIVAGKTIIAKGDELQLNGLAGEQVSIVADKLRIANTAGINSELTGGKLNLLDVALSYDLFINAGVFAIQGTAASKKYLVVDGLTPSVAIGDLNPASNGIKLQVDIPASKIVIDNTAHNAVVRINGTDGFTGTVSPVNSITVKGGIVTAVS